MSKKAVSAEKSQEIFPKIPPGYRAATVEEEYEIFKRGTVINSSNQAIRRCEAEIDRAQMEIREATRKLKDAQAGLGALHKKLGINGDANDIITGPDGKMAILVDKAKRDAALKLITGGKAQKLADEKPSKGKASEEGNADDE